MRKLTYWYCASIDQVECYSIIAKTKREAARMRLVEGADYYELPEKRVLEYRNAYDLFYWATSEAGGRGCGAKCD